MLQVATVLLLLALPQLAGAHTPHDEVELVRLSCAFWLDHTLFAIVRDNLYASFDAGKSWLLSHVNLPRVRVRDVLLSPQFPVDGRLALATDNGLYHSGDKGHSWMPSEHDAAIASLFADAATAVRPKLCLAPCAPGGEFAVIALIDGRVLLSRDFGANWEDTHIRVEGASCMCADADNLYIGSAAGVISRFTWNDTGATRRQIIELDAGLVPTALEVDRERRLLLGTTTHGVWSLRPTGSGCEIKNLGLPGRHITGMFASVAPDGRSLIAVTEWRDGVYRSRDEGRSWEPASTHLTRDPQADQERFRTAHFKAVTGTCAADGRSRLYVSGFDGLFQSDDEGGHWRELDNVVTRDIIVGIDSVPGSACAVSLYGGGIRLVGSRGMTGTGKPLLHGLRTFAIGSPPVPPDGDAEIWVAIHDGVRIADSSLRPVHETSLSPQASRRSRIAALLRSRFTPLAKKAIGHLPPALRSRLRSSIYRGLASYGIGMQTPAFGSSFLFAPDFDASGVAFLRTWDSGLFRTCDGGRTFRRIWLPAVGQQLLCADVCQLMQGQVLFLLTEQSLHCSRDGGASWVCAAIAPVGRLVTMAALPSNTGRCRILLSAATGLYALDLSAGLAVGRCDLVEACSNGAVFTQVTPAPDYPRSGLVIANKSGSGLHRSEDGGATFCPVNTGLPLDCSAMAGFPDGDRMIAFSRSFPTDGTIYAASGCEVFISRSRGADWERLAWIRGGESVPERQVA